MIGLSVMMYFCHKKHHEKDAAEDLVTSSYAALDQEAENQY
jgi:hypothetical protein